MSTDIVSKSPSGCTAHTQKHQYHREGEKKQSKNIPSHIQTVFSRLQLANNVPDAEYATLLHSVSYPSSVLTHSYSHSDPRSSPPPSSSVSLLPQACCLPCACAQPSLCTCACSFSPVPSRFHIPMFESNEAVANVCPDGAHATALTVFAWAAGMFESRENLYVVLGD